MPIFIYSAAKKTGEEIKGEREAADERELARVLRAEELLLLEASEKGKEGSALSLKFYFNFWKFIERLRSVSIVEKMFFSRNLSVMVDAGLSITKAMGALAEESTNKKFKSIIGDIQNSVLMGKSLSDSMRPHEKVFGELYINMVEVGETTGRLTTVLKLLANQMKKDYVLRRRVKGAMIYPAIIIVAIIIVASLMLIYVVPTLTEIIRDLGAELPLTTRIVIAVSDMLANYTPWVLAAVIFVAFLFWRLVLKTSRGKAIFDRAVLQLPVFGKLIKKMNVARFSRTLAYLITAGVPIVKSLEITSRVLGNTLYREAIDEASREIQRGSQLNEILKKYPRIFQPMVAHMIGVGEETGKVSDMLLRLALFFEEDVASTTKNLSVIIEPMLMIVIGVIVGFFVISMLQPIYSSLGDIGI